MNKIDFASIFGNPVKSNQESKSSLSIFFDKNIFEVPSGPDPYIGYKDVIANLDYMMKLGMDKDYFDTDESYSELMSNALSYIRNFAQPIPDYMDPDIIDELGEDALEEYSVGPLLARFMPGSYVLDRFEKLVELPPKSPKSSQSTKTLNLNVTKESEAVEHENLLTKFLSIFNDKKSGIKAPYAANEMPSNEEMLAESAVAIREFCDFVGISADCLVFNDIIDMMTGGGGFSIEFLNIGNSDSKINPDKSYLTDFYTLITLPSNYVSRMSVLFDLFTADKAGYAHVNEEQGVAYVILSVPYYVFFSLLSDDIEDPEDIEELRPVYERCKEITSHCYLKTMDMCWDDNKMFVQKLRHVYSERKAAYESSEGYHPLKTGFGDIIYPYMLPVVTGIAGEGRMQTGICLPLDTLIEFLDSVDQWLIDNGYTVLDTEHLKAQISYYNVNPKTSFAFTTVDNFIQLNPNFDNPRLVSFAIIDTLNADNKMNINTTSYNEPDEDILPKAETISTFIMIDTIETVQVYDSETGEYYSCRFLDNTNLIATQLIVVAANPILTDVELPELISNAGDGGSGEVHFGPISDEPISGGTTGRTTLNP